MVRRSSFTLSALFISVAAMGQHPQLDAPARQLEADVKALAAGRHGQWVELPTGSWSTRHYILELHRGRDDNSVLAQLRVDYIGESSDASGSVVETTWLQCDAGMRRVVAARGYDFQGRPTFVTEMPDAKPEPMKRLYTGEEQLICSQQYLLLDVADGYQRLAELLKLRRTLRSVRVPDRPVPVP